MRAKFVILKIIFSPTVPCQATVVTNNTRMGLRYVLKGRRLIILVGVGEQVHFPGNIFFSGGDTSESISEVILTRNMQK